MRTPTLALNHSSPYWPMPRSTPPACCTKSADHVRSVSHLCSRSTQWYGRSRSWLGWKAVRPRQAQPPQGVDEPVVSPRARRIGPEQVQQVLARQQQRPRLGHVRVDLAAGGGKELRVGVEIVPLGGTAPLGIRLVDHQRAVGPGVAGPAEFHGLVLLGVPIRVQQSAAAPEHKLELVAVVVPVVAAHLLDGHQAGGGPVARRLVGAEKGDARLRIHGAGHGRRRRFRRQRFAQEQRDGQVLEPAEPLVAAGIERQQVGVPRVFPGVVGGLEDRIEVLPLGKDVGLVDEVGVARLVVDAVGRGGRAVAQVTMRTEPRPTPVRSMG